MNVGLSLGVMYASFITDESGRLTCQFVRLAWCSVVGYVSISAVLVTDGARDDSKWVTGCLAWAASIGSGR